MQLKFMRTYLEQFKMVLEFSIYWPHDRCMLGWEYIGSTNEEPMRSYILHLTILTLSLHMTDNS